MPQEGTDAAAQRLYLDSCKDLLGAIASLEASLGAFADGGGKGAGKDEQVQGNVFSRTKARLEQELAAADEQ